MSTASIKYRDATEETIIKMASVGDMEALGELCNRHYEAVLEIVRAELHNQPATISAEDIISDRLELAVAHINAGWGLPDNFVQGFVESAKAEARRVSRPDADAPDAAHLIHHPHPEDIAVEHARHLLAIEIFRGLQPRYQTVLWHTLSGATNADIAELMGVSVNTANVLKHRAIRNLRACWDSHPVSTTPSGDLMEELLKAAEAPDEPVEEEKLAAAKPRRSVRVTAPVAKLNKGGRATVDMRPAFTRPEAARALAFA
ncbi:RNA polymerase sigma factor [Leifsonia sp. Leaf264]|uniref:RNA polymerase sigma factor n=1 Tax=Leifsonia sp. Leaf264 TaxID=1736314 RepID=UPI0006F2217D|nr:sigma-70 family RNA polymerase sigma factor [Leifsonia sp. Leaf264]KQO98700.1 hypothetical protein ASF30_11600 [Leifsonia sp. Leaf264]